MSYQNNRRAAAGKRKGSRSIIILIIVILLIITLLGSSIFVLIQSLGIKGQNTETAAPQDRSIIVKDTTEATIIAQTESTEPATEAESFTITQQEIEDEVERIRTYYYTPSKDDVQKTVDKGENGWAYARDYRFHNGKLVFAFVYDGTEEHRLYFKDDHMIRYIDENHKTYDFPDTVSFSSWEERVLDEAYRVYQNTPDYNSAKNTWLGTWRSSSSDSRLEITDISDAGLTLVFHKTSEAGNPMDVDYQLEFDNPEKTVASEIGGAEDHGGWEYTFVLGEGVITVRSRYPDELFYKE